MLWHFPETNPLLNFEEFRHAQDPQSEARVATLLSQLAEAAPEQRLSAIRLLGKTRDRRGVEPLLAVLNETDPETQAAAARTLAELDDAQARVLLLPWLTSSNPALRAAAIDFLQWIDEPTITEHIVPLLRDEDPQVRLAAVSAFTHRDEPRAVPGLLECASDPDPRVQSYARHAAKGQRDPRVVPLLVQDLECPDGGVRDVSILDVLFRSYTPSPEACLTFLADEDRLVRHLTAVSAHQQFRDRRFVPLLLQQLQDSEELIRSEAIQALAPYTDDPSVMEALIAALTDPEPEVRGQVACSLPYSRRGDIVERLLTLRDDPEPEVRVQLGLALCRFFVPEIAEPLRGLQEVLSPSDWTGVLREMPRYHLRLLQPDLLRQSASPDAQLRAAVAEALGFFSDATILDTLLHLVRDAEVSVAGTAAMSLAYHRHPEGIRFLGQCLQHPDYRVRHSAVYSLGNAGAPEGVDLLLGALHDPHPGLREAAAEALGWLGIDSVAERLAQFFEREHYQPARGAAAVSLGLLGCRSALPMLQSCRESSLGALRVRATEGLALLGDPESLAVLHQQLSGREVPDRLAALPILAYAVGNALDRALLSEDFERQRVHRKTLLCCGMDPATPISQWRITEAVHELGLSLEEVRRRYERLSEELGLKLEWQMMW